VQYLDPVLSGPATLTIHDLKIGKKHSVIQVEIKKPDSPKTCIIALVTHGNLSKGGNSIDTPPFQVQDRERECQRWADGFFFHVSPTSAQYRAYTPTGGPNPLWSPRVGRNARDMWVKLDDESDRLNCAHLGVIADLVCAAVLQDL
jgi:hypothetical protein